MKTFSVRYPNGRELEGLGIGDTVLSAKCLFDDAAIEEISELRVGETIHVQEIMVWRDS